MNKADYSSEEEMRALVRKFEDCSLADEEFDHRAHLAVAVCYLSGMTADEAARRMREGLLRFLSHYGVDPQKYNETMTQFWVRRLDALLNEADAQLPWLARANGAIERAGGSNVIFDYYTRERLFSEEARTGFVQPDKEGNR